MKAQTCRKIFYVPTKLLLENKCKKKPNKKNMKASTFCEGFWGQN